MFHDCKASMSYNKISDITLSSFKISPILYQILIQLGGETQQFLLVTLLHGFLQLFLRDLVACSFFIHRNPIGKLFRNVHEPVPNDGIWRFVVDSGYELPQLFPLSVGESQSTRGYAIVNRGTTCRENIALILT